VEWQPLAIGALTLAAAAFFLVPGVWRLRLWLLVVRTPTSPAGEVAPGPAEVVGAVEAEGPLERGPFSGDEATYGRWTVEELRKSGKRRAWRVVEEGHVGGPFRVRDPSGAVRVDPEDAEGDLEVTWAAESGFGRDPPEQVARFLAARGRSFEGIFGMNLRMRYRERLLVPGAQVYVLGTAAPDPRMRMTLGKGPRFPFLLSRKAERGVRWRALLSGLGAILAGLGILALGLFVLRLRWP
jgi:hypothetical protein